MVNPGNLKVPTLAPCAIESPLQRHWAHAHEAGRFVSDEDKILVDAGQEWFDAVRETDLSGNIRLQDIVSCSKSVSRGISRIDCLT